MIQMSSDFAEIWYAMVFECAEYEYGPKFWSDHFLSKKLMFFWGWVPQK